MSWLNASLTLCPVAAEVSKQNRRFWLMQSQMTYCFTSLNSVRSDLFPTSITVILGSALSRSSPSHFWTFSKDLDLVRSKAMMAPTAPRQQALVMALNLSWPAVSQIWFLMDLASMLVVLVANSTPMVGLESVLKELSTNRERRLVLPTPESPIMTILKRKSKSYCLVMCKLIQNQRRNISRFRQIMDQDEALL